MWRTAPGCAGGCARGGRGPGLRPSSPPPPLAGHRVTFPFLPPLPLLPASFRCTVTTGSGPRSGRTSPAFGLPHLLPPRGDASCMVFPPLLPLPPRPAPALPATPPARAHPDTTAPRQGSPGRRSPSPLRARGGTPLSRGLVSALPPAPWAADGGPHVAACEAPSSASPGSASTALVHARGRRPLRMPGWRSSPPLPSSAGWVALRAPLPVPWYGCWR